MACAMRQQQHSVLHQQTQHQQQRRVFSCSASSSSSLSAAACRRSSSSRCRRQPLRVSAILSSGNSSSTATHAPPTTPTPLSSVSSVRDATPTVVAKATDSDAAVPLPPPEPERTPPQIDASWLNAVLDSVVRAPYVAYSRSLKTRPLLTKALTSFVGFVLGDLIAQHFSHPGAIDVLRAARLGAYGFLIDGPVGSTWYDILEKYIYPTEQTSTKAVLAKTALDQVVYATIMTAVYFAVIKTMEGQPDMIWATLQSKFVPTLAANYAIWPLAHIINFRFVPADYRILYNNVVCVAWLTYLSLLTHTKINLLSFLHFH